MTYRSALAAAVATWSLATGAIAADPSTTPAAHPPAVAPRAYAYDGALEAIRIRARHHDGGAMTGGAVELGFSGTVGGHALRLGTTWSDEERRYDLAIASDDVTFNLFAGSGESYGRLDPGDRQVDPFFFHGGSHDAFDYRGAAADFAVGRVVSLQFALADIVASGLDDRRTTYAGFTTGNASAGVFNVSREDDATADGVMLSWAGRAGVMDLRQIEHESGARYRSMGFARATDNGQRFSVDVRAGRNPLFRDNDETRIMFRLSGTLGAPPPDALAANESVENGEGATADDEQAGAGKTRGLAVLGGALVAIGVASSSGSDERDGAIRIRNRDNAARQVLNRINPVSVRQNREHGGWIYRNADGTFGYTEPVAGTVSSVNIGPKSVVPRGTQASASYHTHGGPDPRFDNENFSPSDLLSDRLQQTDGYLGTPAGFMKLHNFRTGEITVRGRINN